MNLVQYWRHHPPVHLLLAGFVGFKPPTKLSARPEPAEATPEQIGEFESLFGPIKQRTKTP